MMPEKKQRPSGARKDEVVTRPSGARKDEVVTHHPPQAPPRMVTLTPHHSRSKPLECVLLPSSLLPRCQHALWWMDLRCVIVVDRSSL
jgi:hypothetical protein